MEFHEVANIFPLIDGIDFQQLVHDIQANGLREPIWTYQNKIIDGRNRYRACQESGITPQFRAWNGEGSLVAFVVSLNLQRRHLTSSQKAMVALEVEKQLAVEADKRVGGRPRLNEEKPVQKFEQLIDSRSSEQAAKITGTNRQYIVDAKRIVEKAPELKEAVLKGTLNIPEAKAIAKLPEPQRNEVVNKITSGEVKNVKEAKAIVKQEERQEVFQKTIVELEHYKVYHCNVSDLHLHVEPSSVDCIITDPPYPQEYLPVYDLLGKFADYALKPGGSLLVMIGQSYLPYILQYLCEYLDYHWTLAYLTPGGQSAQLWQRNVNTFWKPLLWFTKGKYSGEWIGDVCKSNVNDNDKNHHHWGQSESGMADIIERFTYPGQLICDPFVGGGTTASVAAQLRRRFIGCDIDESCVQKTLQRVSEVVDDVERANRVER